MEWKKFQQSPREYPEKIVLTTIAGFSKATEELVELIVVPMLAPDRIASHLGNDFLFNVYLRSALVGSYKMKVISFGYNVELAPIFVDIEDTIFESTFQRRKKPEETIKCSEGEDFKNLIEEVFRSPRFMEIVSGIMKIAAKNKK